MVDYSPNFETTEKDMADNLYRKMKDTDFAADVFSKYPEVDIVKMAKVLAQGGMDGRIGEFTRKLTDNHKEFMGIAQRAMETAFLRCLQEHKKPRKGGSDER